MPATMPHADFTPLPEKRPEGAVCPFPNPNPRGRLFVFPHAGAGPSAYHAMAKALHEASIEVIIVAYPGREIRYSTPPAQSMADMIKDLETQLASLLSLGPFAFYGHSMGALLCFEYARHLINTDQNTPLFMGLTGRQAPSVKGFDLAMNHLSDEEFLNEVNHRYNAIPREVMNTPELIELLLPAMRADFSLVANYQYDPCNRLNIPAYLVNGTEDQWVSKDATQPWNQNVIVEEQHWLTGGHFFLNDNMDEVKSLLLSAFANTLTQLQ